MEKPDAATVALYETSVPGDARAVRGQMFGHPCAFVNGNLFFGTFGASVIARVGPDRAAALATPPVTRFEPRPGRPWAEYVRVPTGTLPEADVAALAREALAYTAGLPPKAAKAAKAPKKRKA